MGAEGALPAAASAVTPAVAPSGGTSAPEKPSRRSTLPGSFGAILQAAGDLELTPEQKTALEKVDASTRGADLADRGNVMRTVLADLAAGIRAGTMDTARLEKSYAALDKMEKDRHDVESVALNDLHKALEPAQRKSLATSVRAQVAAAESNGRSSAADKDAGLRKLERWTKNLELDEAQKQKLAALPKDEGKVASDPVADERKVLATILVAFEKDAFDAKKLPAPNLKKGRATLTEDAQFFSRLLPILTPEQRTKLAESLDHGGGAARPARNNDAGAGR